MIGPVLPSRGWVRSLAERAEGIDEFTPAFPAAARCGDLSLWYRPDSPIAADTARLLEYLAQSAAPDPSAVRVLKQFRRRSIFACRLAAADFVVKAYPLERLRESWRWRRYAPAEARHLLHADWLGIAVPRCHGLFRVRRGGRVVNCGLVMEQLLDADDLATLASRDPVAILRAIPVLVQLYDRGVFHRDVNPSNMFFPHNGGPAALIDWQLCSFESPRSDRQLVEQAARFLNYAGVACDAPLGRRWIAELLRQSGCPLSLPALSHEIATACRTSRRPGDSFHANGRRAA